MANVSSEMGALKLRFRSRAARAIAAVAFFMIIGKLADGTLMYAQATPVAELATEHVMPVFVHGRTLFLTPTQVERSGPLHWTSLLSYILVVAAVAVESVKRASTKNEI